MASLISHSKVKHSIQLLLLTVFGLSLQAQDFTEYMSFSEYQRHFNEKRAQGLYPTEVEGRTFEGRREYRGKFAFQPWNNFGFFAIHGWLAADYEKQVGFLNKSGVTQEFVQSYIDAAGQERYQAIWVQESVNFSPWMETAAFETELNAQSDIDNYPIEIQGRLSGDMHEYRGFFVFKPWRAFEYAVTYGSTQSEFDALIMEQSVEKERILFYTSSYLDETNTERFQAVWIQNMGGEAFYDWIRNIYGSEGDSNILARASDPDGDGINNYLEFALGRLPNVPDTTASHTFSVDTENNLMRFAYTRPEINAPVKYQLWQSIDLANWTPFIPSSDEESIALINNDTEQVEVKISLESERTKFVQLRIGPN